jgi:hypothetical protein
MTPDDDVCLERLPFPVHCDAAGTWSSGRDVEVRIECPSTVPETRPLLRSIVGRFVALANSGALAGDAIPPWKSGLSLSPGSGIQPGAVVVRFASSRVHPGAWTVLLNMLLPWHAVIEISSIRVTSGGPVRRWHADVWGSDILPPAYGLLPFALDDEEPESGAYTFTARCVEPIREDALQGLRDALNTWVAVVQAGGYEIATEPPASSYVEPGDDGLIAFGSTMEWSIFKVRADPDCIDGIINIFAAHHHRIQPIASLEIT